jgi:hypothetical protein
MAIYMWREYIPPKALCFTANTAWSKVTLNSTGSPTAVTLEKSTDGTTWTSYSIWQTITLSNIGDKICFRNTSTTNTGFSTNWVNYYYFSMDGSISASWDACYLLNKNGTTTLSTYCFYSLFKNCTSLTTSPSLWATTLWANCYSNMFQDCTNLTTLPSLPAIWTLPNYCYNLMFYWCSKIKLSTTQTWEYQTEYRVPTSWTATSGTGSSNNMFTNTWWTFTWAGSNKVLNFNTTYYTSNQVI